MTMVLLLIIAGSVCIFFSGFIVAKQCIPLSTDHELNVNENNIIAKSNIVINESPLKYRFSDQLFSNSPKDKAHIFNSIADSLAVLNHGNGVVISDQMGFLISSSREYSEELAAISVLHQSCEKIINRNINFGNLNQIVFSNDKNLYLNIYPLHVDETTVYITGLSHSKIDYKLMLDKMLQAFGK